MAHSVLTNAKIWVAEYDLSADMNALSCEYVAAAVEDSNFGDASEINLGGNRSTAFEASGRYEAANSDLASFTYLGADDTPISFARIGTEGQPAYFFNGLVTGYVPSGSQGEMFAFDLSAAGDGELVRGTIMENDTITAAGDGTGRQLGAVADTEALYAVLHVPTYSSGTWTVTVESDDNSGFTSATTRVTFSNVTGITSEYATPVSGAIADDYWRVSYSGSGSFAPVVIIGIK